LKQFVSLQYLRALAALGVVVFHFTHQGLLPPEAAALFERGQFGVDLFFVLSGFIMWTTTIDRAAGPAAFLGRRIARVAPLYWALTLMAAFVATEPSLALGFSSDAATLLTSLLFIPAWSPKSPEMVAPLLTVGWTLNLEMAFYALFAGGLLLRASVRLPALCGVLAAASLAGLFVTSQNPAIEAYTNSAMIEFAYGAALAHFHRAGALRSGGGAALIAAGVALALVAPFDLDWRGFTFGLAAAAILAGFVLLEEKLAQRPIRLAKLVGDASYSLYLTHGMALAGMAVLVRRIGAPVPAPLLIFAEIVFATIIAVFIYCYVERPLTRLTQGLTLPRAAPAPLRAIFRLKQDASQP
jgi:exopolysaccharide production protein ExoZ